jgi:hypothetical protein
MNEPKENGGIAAAAPDIVTVFGTSRRREDRMPPDKEKPPPVTTGANPTKCADVDYTVHSESVKPDFLRKRGEWYVLFGEPKKTALKLAALNYLQSGLTELQTFLRLERARTKTGKQKWSSLSIIKTLEGLRE